MRVPSRVAVLWCAAVMISVTGCSGQDVVRTRPAAVPLAAAYTPAPSMAFLLDPTPPTPPVAHDPSEVAPAPVSAKGAPAAVRQAPDTSAHASPADARAGLPPRSAGPVPATANSPGAPSSSARPAGASAPAAPQEPPPSSATLSILVVPDADLAAPGRDATDRGCLPRDFQSGDRIALLDAAGTSVADGELGPCRREVLSPGLPGLALAVPRMRAQLSAVPWRPGQSWTLQIGDRSWPVTADLLVDAAWSISVSVAHGVQADPSGSEFGGGGLGGGGGCFNLPGVCR